MNTEKHSSVDMSVNIAGVEWKNPVTVASGPMGRKSDTESRRGIRWNDERHRFAESGN